jgi:protein tyrosine/serine phosphatase
VTRALDWDGCANVRDLGGLPLEQGGETRRGAFIRADNIRRLTDAGWASLAERGVTRIVDLRLPEELEADPPRELEIEVVHVSLVGEADPNFHHHLDDHEDDVAYWSWVYIWMLENRRKNIVSALAAIVEGDGTVLFHCHGGKDRTGVVAALALRAAGVSADEIVADYALSGARGGFQDWVDEAPDEQERARRARLTSTPPEAMARALDHLDRQLGGADAYLRDAGFSDEQLARLRDRLAAA